MPADEKNDIGEDIMFDIMGLKQAEKIPCEVTISDISFKYVWDNTTFTTAVLKDFKQL